jgi:hypothetical protein
MANPPRWSLGGTEPSEASILGRVVAIITRSSRACRPPRRWAAKHVGVELNQGHITAFMVTIARSAAASS